MKRDAVNTLGMRLFRRPPKTHPLPRESEWTWYAELDRKTRISLKTADPKLAKKSYDKLKKLYLTRNLAIMEGRTPTKRLEDFAEEYLDWAMDVKRPFSVQTDRQAFRRALRYFRPTTALGDITRRQVDAWLASMGQEVKRVSANTWFRHFKAAMSKAVEWGYLKVNPAVGVKQLRVDELMPRYLEKEEIKRLLAAEDDPRFRDLWLFYLLTGCRRGEALQVRGQDINWQEERLTVGQTKNRAPKVIWFTPELENLLRTMPEVGRFWTWTLDHVTHHFHATAVRAGIKCRLHDLRHTYASHKAMSGVDLFTLKELLGHKDIKATQIYAHLSDAHLREASLKGIVGDE